MRYSDEQRVKKIYDYAVKLMEYIDANAVTREQIMQDESLQWLVTTPLYNIGEHAYNLSREYKTAHADVEWHLIAGMRHRLVHDYDGANWNIIARAIFEEIPLLIKELERYQETE